MGQTPLEVLESASFGLAAWRHAVCESFVVHDCQGVEPELFSGHIESSSLGDLTFSTLRSSAQEVRRDSHHIRSDSKELLLVALQVSGSCSLEQDGRDSHLQPGDIACFDTMRPYALSFRSDFQQIVLQVPRTLIHQRVGPTTRYVSRTISGSTPMGALMFPFLSRAARMSTQVPTDTARGIADASLGILATALGDMVVGAGESLGHRWASGAILYRANAYIENHLDEPPLNAETVAQHLGVSMRYLQQVFQQHGLTVSDVIWKLRLQRSRRKLADPVLSGQTISQIALACGFVDFTHFSRRFKAAFAQTPTEFRRAASTSRSPIPDRRKLNSR